MKAGREEESSLFVAIKVVMTVQCQQHRTASITMTTTRYIGSQSDGKNIYKISNDFILLWLMLLRRKGTCVRITWPVNSQPGFNQNSC